MPELDLDTFGEIVDDALTKSHNILLLESVEGTQEVTVSGLSGSSVLQFYFILQAISTILSQMCAEFKIDATSPEWNKTVDQILELVKHEAVK